MVTWIMGVLFFLNLCPASASKKLKSPWFQSSNGTVQVFLGQSDGTVQVFVHFLVDLANYSSSLYFALLVPLRVFCFSFKF